MTKVRAAVAAILGSVSGVHQAVEGMPQAPPTSIIVNRRDEHGELVVADAPHNELQVPRQAPKPAPFVPYVQPQVDWRLYADQDNSGWFANQLLRGNRMPVALLTPPAAPAAARSDSSDGTNLTGDLGPS